MGTVTEFVFCPHVRENTVAHNGLGLPPGLDLEKPKTLGLRLVTFLARHQLRAEAAVTNTKGTEFIFRLN